MGQATGEVVAEAVFGDIIPGGKLPISIPRSVGHIPSYYNYRPSARRGYLLDDVSPLFPFGFGLSYTQFEFSEPRLAKSTIGPNESSEVSIDITNTGARAGDEVVQMYIRDRVSSVTRPVKELKGFSNMKRPIFHNQLLLIVKKKLPADMQSMENSLLNFTTLTDFLWT